MPVVPAPQKAATMKSRGRSIAWLLLLGGIRTVIRFGKMPRPADLAEEIIETFLHESTSRSATTKPAKSSKS